MEPRHRRNEKSPFAPPEGRTRPEWAELSEESEVPVDIQQIRTDKSPESHDSGAADKSANCNTGDELENLICTLASMMSFFSAFLLWAEKSNSRIRHFGIRSVFLTVLNIVLGGSLYAVGRLIAPIPFLGMVVDVFCLTAYLILLIVLMIFRLQMMKHAWNGEYMHLPLAENWIAKTWHV